MLMPVSVTRIFPVRLEDRLRLVDRDILERDHQRVDRHRVRNLGVFLKPDGHALGTGLVTRQRADELLAVRLELDVVLSEDGLERLDLVLLRQLLAGLGDERDLHVRDSRVAQDRLVDELPVDLERDVELGARRDEDVARLLVVRTGRNAGRTRLGNRGSRRAGKCRRAPRGARIRRQKAAARAERPPGNRPLLSEQRGRQGDRRNCHQCRFLHGTLFLSHVDLRRKMQVRVILPDRYPRFFFSGLKLIAVTSNCPLSVDSSSYMKRTSVS